MSKKYEKYRRYLLNSDTKISGSVHVIYNEERKVEKISNDIVKDFNKGILASVEFNSLMKHVTHFKKFFKSFFSKFY